MKYRRSISAMILLIVAFSPVSPGQPSLSFSGYILTFPSFQHFSGQIAAFEGVDPTQFNDITRMRLRPEASLWENARLCLEYELAALYHSSPLTSSQQADQSSHQTVPLTWIVVKGDHFIVKHTIDRLFFHQTGSWGDVIVGRQRIAWGTGRIWNPTDLFNPLNPAIFSKIEKDGVDAAMLKLRLGDLMDLSLVYNPQHEFSHTNAGARFRSNLEEVDFSLAGGVFNERIVAGGDVAGNLLDAGVRGEMIVSKDTHDTSATFVKFITGIDYQFTPLLYALLEYHYNGEGTTDESAYDVASLARGDILNVGKYYLAAQSTYLVHPLVTCSVTWIGNLGDGSQYIGAAASYSASDEIAVGAGTQIFLGTPGSEYSYYPLTVYLKCDIYF